MICACTYNEKDVQQTMRPVDLFTRPYFIEKKHYVSHQILNTGTNSHTIQAQEKAKANKQTKNQ